MSILFPLYLHIFDHIFFNMFSSQKTAWQTAARLLYFSFLLYVFIPSYYTRRLTDTIVLYVASLLILIPS